MGSIRSSRDIVRSAARSTRPPTPFAPLYRLEELKRAASEQWRAMDVLLLPTAGTIYTQDAVAADPIALNTNLGYYTNFVNLMDLAAVAVPAGFRSRWLAVRRLAHRSGVLGRWRCWRSAERYLDGDSQRSQVARVHRARRRRRAPDRAAAQLATHRARRAPGEDVPHVAGLPALCAAKHHSAQAGLSRATRSSAVRGSRWKSGSCLRISSAASSPPCRRRSRSAAFSLDDGAWVKGFVCEGVALKGATEITRFGGWRNYVTARAAS